MSEFETFIKKELNSSQRKAVLHTSGPLLVIAGAGSGKTRVITSRITHLLLNEQAHPATIVALTFTNKAASEMKERIAQSMKGKRGIPFVGTFHSYCLYLLKTTIHLLPFDTFSILDEDDKRVLIGKLLKQSPLYKKYTSQQISYQISLLKNQNSNPKQSFAQLIEEGSLKELMYAYEKEKRASNCFDFDDLLLEATKLFEDEEFKNDHQNRVRHVLVDEYQDTNVIQHILLKHMSLAEKKELAIDSMCVVGDEDQSIYSWRGATVDNIINFKKDFKKTKLIKIEQNYRSKQPILATANSVIKHNSKRNEKKLWSERAGRDCVRSIRCLSGYQEADALARFCKILYKNKRLDSTVILYRTHFQSRVIEEALLKHSIPYTIVGGIRFYERKEIKDMLAYLRLIHNPFDRVAFTRSINCPSRGLGIKFLEEFMLTWSKHEKENFKKIALRLMDSLPPNKKEALQQFCKLFLNKTSQSAAAETIGAYITNSNYLLHLKKSYEKQEADERHQNIKELLNAAHFFAGQGKTSIETFLDEVSLLQEKANKEEKKETGVTMMTLHAVKGLEFDNVIIAGLEESLLPSSRSLDNKNKLEEERRLFYVGITRARNRLLLSHARYRQMYGQMEEAAPSRFSYEVPQNMCRSEDVSSWQHYEVTKYLSLWLGFSSANPEVFTFSAFKPPSAITKKTIKPATLFKKHQTIKHKTFGIGIIKTVEKKKEKTFVTAQFKIGIKKIDAKFVQKV